jgi:Leucine-rich repeat (LRR) protein
LTGTIPQILLDNSKYPSLKRLSLGDNYLSGTLPSFVNVSDFTVISIANSENENRGQISGTIPNLDNFTSLRTLLISNQNLTGSIPSLDKCVKLRELYLTKNLLSGQIPSLLKLTLLVQLGLFGNELIGTIPPINSTFLTELKITSNRLSGTVPSFSICKKTLRTLFIAFNHLTGILPNLEDFPKLRFVAINHNYLSGALPNFTDSFDLELLFASENSFTGTIPSYLHLRNIFKLALSNNQLTGTIPLIHPSLSLLQIDYSFNDLSGTIPNQICDLSQLVYLSLASNRLSGSVPPLHLPNIMELDLSGNELTHISIIGLLQLEYLYLQKNHFKAITLLDVPDLSVIHMMFNNLTKFPDFLITYESNLSHVDLSHCQINESIPRNWKLSSKLKFLDLSFNDISSTDDPSGYL